MSQNTGRRPSANTIAITGATGLIGSALVHHLRARGHIVRRIVRTAPGPGDVLWDPAHDLLDARALVGVDAVVNLAGEPIAHRWTAARKAAIRDSRVQGTALLARTIAALPSPPALLSGSAVGYYGDRGDEVLDESSAAGRGFLAEVCAAWEGATEPAARAGARVVLLRTGIVLDAHEGALAKLLPPFRLGLGGPVGGGHQWMSWIALEDHVRAMEHALFTDSLRGPVNVVAPNATTNAEFARHLAVQQLHRERCRPAASPSASPRWNRRCATPSRGSGDAGARALKPSVAPPVL